MQKTRSTKLLKMIILALLGTVSLALIFLNFPLPMLPPFLKVDFSDVPALIASFIFSPLAGVVVIAIKNVLYLLFGFGEPVGVAANFLAGVMFVLPVSLLYKRYKTTKSIVSGLVTGTIIMAIGMSVLNYFVLLPIYAMFMGMEEFSSIEAVRQVVVIGVLPFNIIKGIIVGALFIPLFKKMRTWIERERTTFAS
ncbi:Riboflavin transporter FmnP [Lentibacillus sp. JNUCC-1]|uniref:ECF transporter S component n=1 Tax=Lentibacillus sp. JNUCC-1 TaxID=2654513 RepID=UPI0012E77FA3|nr:ECF transporter S component [Lentibacillus sp. JNUCC-1]MUV39242.1 Riboflavin transporter FmnP [Lentibacillus sp. JNUCC-1]